MTRTTSSVALVFTTSYRTEMRKIHSLETMMKTNREGLTWTAWKNAAGVSTTAAKRGWAAGEDPSDWRAARVQTYPRMPTRAHAAKYRRDPTKNRLFIGVFPTGISYADRAREVHGDYARCAFLDFSTLSLSFEKGCPTELRAAIQKDAKKIQAKRGETFQVSASGQTVLLGSKRDPVKKHNVNVRRDPKKRAKKSSKSVERGPGAHPEVKEYPSKSGVRDAGTLWVVWLAPNQAWAVFQGPDPFGNYAGSRSRLVELKTTWAEADRVAREFFHPTSRDPKKHLESATMAQLRRPTPRFQHAKGKGHKKFTYEVISLDVWGNEDDGFEVNQAFHTGKFITVQAREHIVNISAAGRAGGQRSNYDVSDRAILAALVNEGFLKKDVTEKDVEIDGESEHELYLQDKKTGEPVFHLQFKGRTL